MESIIQTKKECFVCHTPYCLHKHHVFYGRGVRRISEENGFVVWLCAGHHNMSNEGVHFNHSLDIEIKKLFQTEYEKTHSRDEFIKLVGMNFLY